MTDYWFDKLREITPEEKLILEGKDTVQWDLYTEKNDYVIESSKFMPSQDEDILVRRHTRFIDFPLHRHDYVEIFHVLSGSVTQIVNGDEITIHTGELLLLNQKAEHSIKACGENDLAMNFLIRPVYFQSILESIGTNNMLAEFMLNTLKEENSVNQYLYFKLSDNRCIQNLLQNAYDLLFNKPQNWHTLSEHTFALLFSHILSNAENLLIYQENEQLNVLMLAVRRYIMDYYNTGTLNELADHTGYTPASLSRLIKKMSGYTFKQLQTAQRMEIITNQLSNSSLPINEIAIAAGYENLSFFYKQFQKFYHMTPNDYRKNIDK